MPAELTEFRLSKLEEAVGKIADAVERIAENTAQIVSLEREHAETRRGLERAFSEIERLQGKDNAFESRMTIVERELPALVDIKTNINRGLWGLAGLVCLALVALVIVR